MAINKKKVAILISGGGTNLQALIDAAQAAEYPAEISLVLSNKAEAYGLERAKKANIPTKVINHKDYHDRESFDKAMNVEIENSGAEIVCLAGFMRLISPWFVQQWYNKMINIHPSLLPSFKGLNTHKRALEYGVKITGCTVHFVREEMDVGPIIVQESVNISPNETEESLAAKVLEKEHIAYPKALELVAVDKVKVCGDVVKL